MEIFWLIWLKKSRRVGVTWGDLDQGSLTASSGPGFKFSLSPAFGHVGSSFRPLLSSWQQDGCSRPGAGQRVLRTFSSIAPDFLLGKGADTESWEKEFLCRSHKAIACMFLYLNIKISIFCSLNLPPYLPQSQTTMACMGIWVSGNWTF